MLISSFNVLFGYSASNWISQVIDVEWLKVSDISDLKFVGKLPTDCDTKRPETSDACYVRCTWIYCN